PRAGGARALPRGTGGAAVQRPAGRGQVAGAAAVVVRGARGGSLLAVRTVRPGQRGDGRARLVGGGPGAGPPRAVLRRARAAVGARTPRGRGGRRKPDRDHG